RLQNSVRAATEGRVGGGGVGTGRDGGLAGGVVGGTKGRSAARARARQGRPVISQGYRPPGRSRAGVRMGGWRSCSCPPRSGSSARRAASTSIRGARRTERS